MVLVNVDDNLYKKIPEFIDGVEIKNLKHFVDLAIKEKIQKRG